MDTGQAKRIYERYNPESDVVRCPTSRMAIRDLLHVYARGTVNLYGVISRKDLVTIFNSQSPEQTTVDEIYTLLLPLVLEEDWYCFYKEYIVHFSFAEDFDRVERLLKAQEGKPRFVPESDRIYEFAFENDLESDHWLDARRFMVDLWGSSQNTTEAFKELKDYFTYGDGIREFGTILEKHNLIFTGEEQINTFLNLFVTAKNKTRIWENKGYSPMEIHNLMMGRAENAEDPDDMGFMDFTDFMDSARAKQANPRPHPLETNSIFGGNNWQPIGRNEPCPCGSGKKYKNCCSRFTSARTAQLNDHDCEHFYILWIGLLGFVNEKMNVVNEKIEPIYPNPVPDQVLYLVRNVLWKNPQLIEEYVQESDLPREDVDILMLWRTNYKEGSFIVFRYEAEYAVVIGSNENGEDRLYGLKGISQTVAAALKHRQPAMIKTVLLPYKGMIIYDSFTSLSPISYAQGALESFRRVYENALKHGVITDLG